MSNTLGLYIHIPFCLGKCHYCDFYSLAAPKKQETYVETLCRELINRSATVHTRLVDTVYVGGGTPTVLGADALVHILATVREHYRVTEDAEITVEANPATISAEDLVRLRQVANRLSIGVQSADDKLLGILGRRHTFAEARETVLAAREAGFENISCDLMFGLPGQTEGILFDSLAAVTSLPIDHLSLYALSVEPDTPFGKRTDLVLPDDDTVAAQYDAAVSFLTSVGFAQYEISNFAKEGHRSRHNLRYWNCEEYLGFGPGAYSYFDGVRYGMPRDLAAYLSANGDLSLLRNLQVDREVPGNEEKETEYVMLRFRLTDGVCEADYFARFGRSFHETYADKLQPYIESGHVIATPTGYRFTPSGFAISNYILSHLLSF